MLAEQAAILTFPFPSIQVPNIFTLSGCALPKLLAYARLLKRELRRHLQLQHLRLRHLYGAAQFVVRQGRRVFYEGSVLFWYSTQAKNKVWRSITANRAAPTARS